MRMQPHWMDLDDRKNVRRGQVGGLASENWYWCDQPVTWVSLPSGGWTPVTVPAAIPAKTGDTVQIERVGDTWQVTLILATAAAANQSTSTGGA